MREDQVIRPDGKPGIYGVVDTRIATGVVALSPDHQIYLVGQWRYPFEQYSWEIIEGGADPGETALDAAKRELEEEAGIRAHTWAQLGGALHLSNCFSSEVGVLFIAQDLQLDGAPSPDGTEVLELVRCPLQEAVARVENGEIKDAMSIIAIMRTRDLLKSTPPPRA